MANEVFIDGDFDTIQLRVQRHSTQTHSLQTWEDSAGGVLGQITPDGRLELGDLDLGTPDALIEANKDIDLATEPNVPRRGLQARGLIQGIISDAVAWAVHELELLGSGGVSGLHTALRSRISQKNSGASGQADLRAGDFEAINEEGSSQTPVGKMTGIQSAVTNEDNAHLNEAVGAEIEITNGSGATLQTAYGVRIALPSSASKKYAVHADAGSLHLGDDLELKVFASAPTDNPPADFIKVYPRLDGSDPKLYAKDSGGTEYDLAASAPSAPTGAMVMWSTDTPPSGWLLCYGQAISRATYSGLFNVVGTTFGVGDGSTTFNLPDMRGRFPLGQDDMGGTSIDRVTNGQADILGGNEGEEFHTLTIEEMPIHTHRERVQGNHNPSQTVFVANITTSQISWEVNTQGAGGGQSHNNMPPYLTINYIIKT